MTVMSATLARSANCCLFQPLAAMSSAINCESKATLGVAVSIANRRYASFVFTVNNNFQPLATMQTTGRLESLAMPPRPTFHEALGRYLASFKKTDKKTGWSAEAALAKRQGFPRLTRQVLMRLAKGKTKAIEPETLREFAKFYDTNYESLVAEVVWQVYGAKLGPTSIEPGEIARLSAALARERGLRLSAEDKISRLRAALDASVEADRRRAK